MPGRGRPHSWRTVNGGGDGGDDVDGDVDGGDGRGGGSDTGKETKPIKMCNEQASTLDNMSSVLLETL